MQIELIGHASMLIRTTNRTILMDPVLWDPHQEGLFDIFPKRVVDIDRLPAIDLIIISHKHLDHFDIRSLAALPTDVPVLIPKDPLMEGYLKRIGYKTVHLLPDFAEVKLGETRVFTTRSENPVPEFGVVITDGTGTLWNQVDTVVSTKTAETVRRRYQIDLMIASWQPMLESNFITNKDIGFPYDRYSEILYHIGLASPRAVLPGANAFRYTGASSWMNHVVFPQTRERFLEDLSTILPTGAQRLAGDPGDVVTIDSGAVWLEEQGCSFVSRRSEDRSLLSFQPVAVDSTLVDENKYNVAENELMATVDRVFSEDLPSLFRSHLSHFETHRVWEVVEVINVTIGSQVRSWTLDFRGEHITMSAGASPLANVVTYISASALHGLVTKTSGWDYALLGGFYRTYRRLYHVTTVGNVNGAEVSVVEPLELLFPYQELFTHLLDAEVERWVKQVAADAVPA